MTTSRAPGSHVGLLLLLLCAGCPGRLQDPGQFEVACPPGFDVPTQIFSKTCAQAGCHSGSVPAGGLDLGDAGVANRLINVPSQTAACNSEAYLSGPDAGLLIDKITQNANLVCGAFMPLGLPPLSPNDVACIEAWAREQFVDAGLLPP